MHKSPLYPYKSGLSKLWRIMKKKKTVQEQLGMNIIVVFNTHANQSRLISLQYLFELLQYLFELLLLQRINWAVNFKINKNALSLL